MSSGFILKFWRKAQTI